MARQDAQVSPGSTFIRQSSVARIRTIAPRAMLAVFVLVLLTATANARNYTVNTLDASGNGDCSLRDAIKCRGPTETIALSPGSPAIKAIALADCRDETGKRLKTDQRGFPRPDAGEGVCDIGGL